MNPKSIKQLYQKTISSKALTDGLSELLSTDQLTSSELEKLIIYAFKNKKDAWIEGIYNFLNDCAKRQINPMIDSTLFIQLIQHKANKNPLFFDFPIQCMHVYEENMQALIYMSHFQSATEPYDQLIIRALTKLPIKFWVKNINSINDQIQEHLINYIYQTNGWASAFEVYQKALLDDKANASQSGMFINQSHEEAIYQALRQLPPDALYEQLNQQVCEGNLSLIWPTTNKDLQKDWATVLKGFLQGKKSLNQLCAQVFEQLHQQRQLMQVASENTYKKTKKNIL